MEKMIGVVTLYNPDKAQTLSNISRYAPFLEALVVWDNSAENHGQWFAEPHILYHWTGENTCIAPALNYTWQKAVEGNYSSILIMDQDSTWDDFAAYRKDIEEIPETYLQGVTFHYVENVREVLDYALLKEKVKEPVQFVFDENEEKK